MVLSTLPGSVTYATSSLQLPILLENFNNLQLKQWDVINHDTFALSKRRIKGLHQITSQFLKIINSIRVKFIIKVENQQQRQRMFSLGRKGPQNRSIYQMQYTPKLTSQLLADSDITEHAQQSEQEQEEGQGDADGRYEQIVAKWSKHGACSHPGCEVKGISSSKYGVRVEEDVYHVANRIRSGVEHFVATIGSKQPMTLSLELAIQNLLLQMLQIANSLPSLLMPQESPKMTRMVAPAPSQPTPSFNPTPPLYQNHIKIEDGDDLPILSQEPIAEQNSSVYSSCMPSSQEQDQDQQPGLCSEDDHIVDKLLEMKMEYGKGPLKNMSKHKDKVSGSGNRYYELYLRYKDGCRTAAEYIGGKDKKNRLEVHSDFQQKYSRQNYQQKQQQSGSETESQLQSQIGSQIGIEQPSNLSVLMSQNGANNTYHSASQRFIQSQYQSPLDHALHHTPCHPTNMHKNKPLFRNNANQPEPQAHTNSKQQMQYSISEYYIEESPAHSTKNGKENECVAGNQRASQVSSGGKSAHLHAHSGATSSHHPSYLYSQVLSRRKIF